MWRAALCLVSVGGLLFVGCGKETSELESSVPQGEEVVGGRTVGAGFRFSTYGPEYDPGPDYWAGVGQQMADRFTGSIPEAIWIVGRCISRTR